MNAFGLLQRLGPADVRSIRRDPVLVWALALPIIVALLLRWGTPAFAEWLRLRIAFDLAPYYPLVTGAYILVAPSVVGFIGGFLLLDERDERVLDAIRVTPVPINSLLIYRLGVPLAVGGLSTIVCYLLLNLVALPVASLIVSAALAACSGPILALFLITFADNKVSGFALTKVFSALSNVTLVAWFVPMPWQLGAGVAPWYWPMKVIWQAAAGGGWLVYALGGLALNALLIVALLQRLRAVLAR
jgi:fluoroquinolone transport system permease protein